MKHTVFRRARSLLLAVLCLVSLALPLTAVAETYTMEVDGTTYSIDGTTGPIRFGTARELGYDPSQADAAFRIMLVPAAFKLKSGSTVISSELYSLDIQDSLVFYNAVENGTVEYTGGQVVWCKDNCRSGDWWHIGKPKDTDWTTAGTKSAANIYKGIEMAESKEARCCFTFKDKDGESIIVEGKLTVTGKCASDDCHMLTASGSVVVKVAHVITLDQQGATTPGTLSVKAAQDADMPEITVPEKTDNTFGGFFSQTKGKGTQYYDATGANVKKWDKDAKGTLYAYWIPDKPEPVPETGDNNSPFLFMALLASSVGALTVLLRRKNRG